MLNAQFSITNIQAGKTAEKSPDRVPFFLQSRLSQRSGLLQENILRIACAFKIVSSYSSSGSES